MGCAPKHAVHGKHNVSDSAYVSALASSREHTEEPVTAAMASLLRGAAWTAAARAPTMTWPTDPTCQPSSTVPVQMWEGGETGDVG